MKKKSTLLVVLLSLVCLVCAAIGLTACNPDNGDGTKTIKLGETNIGTVDENGVVCNIEGAEAGKEYVITAKVDGEVSQDVVIAYTVGAKVDMENGTLEITYATEGTLKLSTLSGEVENVTIDMSVKTYPAGHIKNPLTLTYNTDTDYTVNNTTVWYKITVAEEGSYEITGVDNLTVVYGPASSLSGNSLTESLTTKIFSLTANTEYYVGVTSTSDVTGTLKVIEYVQERPSVYDLTEGTPLTLENLKVGDTVTVNIATEAGKTYTVEATSEHVFVLNRLQGTDEFPYVIDGSERVDFGDVAVLVVTVDEDVATVTLTLTVTNTPDPDPDPDPDPEPDPGDDYPAVTLDEPVNFNTADCDENYYVYYKLVITAGGDYSITVSNIGENLLKLQIGDEIDSEGGIDYWNEIEAADGYYYLNEGTYYIALTTLNNDFSDFTGTFVVAAKD